MRKIYTLCLIVLFVGMGKYSFGQNNGADSVKHFSPLDFGLAEAETDSARYEVLYKTHVAALAAGADVDYSGITELSVEITAESPVIPLTQHNDFKGLVLTVKNKAKKCFMFSMLNEGDSIFVDKELLGGNDFSTVDSLAKGLHLLVLEDETPWVSHRSGYNYGAIRKDILLVDDGKAKNQPVSSYTTDTTKPKCMVIPVTKEEKTICNLTIKRSSESTYKALCFQISGQNNLKISKLTIVTPKNKSLYADEAISISNCTNLYFEDVKIDGTYSQTDKYGYGIQLNNVWNSKYTRLVGHGNWGVFGTNNMNSVVMKDCEINRFDIHCYGRDVQFVNCKFSKLYNQFSSMYGQISYESCSFTNFTPVLIETTYNAYTGFDLLFKNCVFEASESNNYLVSMGYLTDTKNDRPELKEKCWPNVTIKNLTVNVPDAVKSIVLFKTKGTISTKYAVGYISKIKIDGLKFNYSGSGHSASFYISSDEVQTKKALTCLFNNMDFLPVPDAKIEQATAKYTYPASIHFNLHRKDARDMIRITKSRLNFNPNANTSYNITFDNCTIGLLRYSTIANATRRQYKNCKIYLNCSDDKRYYIDNRANYTNCTFIPCDNKMFVDFFGNNNDVTFKNCKTTRKYALIYKGKLNNDELKRMALKGKRN